MALSTIISRHLKLTTRRGARKRFLKSKTKEVIRMAKSKLAVIEGGAEQTVMEPEAGKEISQR